MPHFSDSSAAGIFAATKAIAARKGIPPNAAFEALPPHFKHPAVQKAAVSVIDGNGLMPSQNAVALLEVERRRSFVAAALPDFQQLPLYTRLVMNAVAFTGSIVDPQNPIPVKKGNLSGTNIEPQKAAAIIAVSNELLDALNAKGITALNRLLASACATATDTVVLSNVIAHAGTATVTSTGRTPDKILADAKEALDVVNISENSGRYYWVGTPDMANFISTVEEGGIRSFPEMSPKGGEFVGLPFVVSSSAPETDSSGGKLILVDAGRIALTLDTLDIQAGEHAAIEMEDHPADPLTASVTQVSMWQNNLTAIRAILTFGFEIIDDALPMAAVIEGI